MDYKKLHKIVDDHFESVTPEEAVEKLEALGCEFEEVQKTPTPTPNHI